MITVDIPNTLLALIRLHDLFKNEYEAEEQTPQAQLFFNNRATLLSYLISRDALTDVSISAEDDLIRSLETMQQMHLTLFNESIKLYTEEFDQPRLA